MTETEDYATGAAWDDITGKPTEFAPEAHATSHEAGGSDELLAASYVNRFTRPGRLYASDGTTLKNLYQTTATVQDIPANGDRIQMFFIADGTETKLTLGQYKTASSGIFDLYVNGVLDSSGYDNYSSSGVIIQRQITPTQPIVAGLNTIEMRVNGKNASSTNYGISTYGVNIS